MLDRFSAVLRLQDFQIGAKTVPHPRSCSEILVRDCIRYYIFDFLRECTLMRTRFRLQRYKEFLRYTNIRKKFLKIIQRPMAYYLRQGLLLVYRGSNGAKKFFK